MTEGHVLPWGNPELASRGELSTWGSSLPRPRLLQHSLDVCAKPLRPQSHVGPGPGLRKGPGPLRVEVSPPADTHQTAPSSWPGSPGFTVVRWGRRSSRKTIPWSCSLKRAMRGTRCGDDGGEGEKARGRAETGPLELRGQESTGTTHPGPPGGPAGRGEEALGMSFIAVTVTVQPFYYYCHPHD